MLPVTAFGANAQGASAYDSGATELTRPLGAVLPQYQVGTAGEAHFTPGEADHDHDVLIFV